MRQATEVGRRKQMEAWKHPKPQDLRQAANVALIEVDKGEIYWCTKRST